MPIHEIRSLGILLSLGALLSGPASAQAVAECKCSQSTRLPAPRSVVLQGGGWLVDLDATVVAARVELPLGRTGRWLLVPGLTFGRGYLRAGPNDNTVLVPEALFHYQLSRGRVRPYLGSGAGLALGALSDGSINSVVMIASGLRADLTPQWGARLETDLRIFGTNAGTVGWGLGIARRF